MNRYEELKNRFQQEINAFPHEVGVQQGTVRQVDAGAWP